jgi:hypothetical protein
MINAKDTVQLQWLPDSLILLPLQLAGILYPVHHRMQKRPIYRFWVYQGWF